MTERRYNDEEVAVIFAKAAEAKPATQLTPAPREGMTLSDLEDIARQVGIEPDVLRAAAKSIDRHVIETSRRFLGLPIGVGRTIELDRPLSDAEWEHFVTDLRQTFDATGRLRTDGSFRQWSNGNLQARLEPTASGQRLSLRTFKSTAGIYLSGGLAVLALAAAFGVSLAAGASGTLSVAKVAQIAILGAGIFSYGALTIPAWARRRRKQMDELITRLTK